MPARGARRASRTRPRPPLRGAPDGPRQERGRLESPGEALVGLAASRERRAMDAEQAEVRVLEAEVAALKRALEELPAPGEDTARVQYVALLRSRGAGGSVSSRVRTSPRTAEAPTVAGRR